MKITLSGKQAEELYQSASKLFLLGELIDKDSVERISEAGCNGLAWELIEIGNTLMSIYNEEDENSGGNASKNDL